ncbi:ABC transporter ATP-binding protein [Paenisporosarcina indica]|uniref:ABC transporter ATP-binding protein n=1 Tax=Paenisporosarcina indica TaxID=650093 RepID=UPI000A00C193|nr:ATP-binding cassette domain-containing protein [Paenisporosarcina indica]
MSVLLADVDQNDEIHVGGSISKNKIVSATGLSKSFGNFVAVKSVDFEMYEGEVLGLLGPNGAGKTTLISMLSGVLRPDGGKATVGGHDILKDLNKIKKMVSLVPQDLALYMELTAYDNLAFFANLYGLRGKLKKERIHEALEMAQLHKYANKKVGSFSGGMKRRLNLAIGILNHPKLMLLDEPTVGVDPQSRNHIFETIKKLVSDFNMSVVYTTHYMEEAETLCDRVAIYDQGTVLDIDDTSSLLQKHGHKQLEIKMKDVDESLIEKIKNMKNVDSVNYIDETLYINSSELLERTEEVLRIIREKGLVVSKFNVRESNLEDVFLKLTGKKLRD